MLARKLCPREQFLSILWSENIDKLSKPLFLASLGTNIQKMFQFKKQKFHFSLFLKKSAAQKLREIPKQYRVVPFFLVQIDPNLFWLSLRTKFWSQSFGHKRAWMFCLSLNADGLLTYSSRFLQNFFSPIKLFKVHINLCKKYFGNF